ncbi:MAG: hypothetical protein CMM50_01680 [Rhodospirillaceae bacterium]|nr:hypothetical protein [Rhodospirillaceae bacterium]
MQFDDAVRRDYAGAIVVEVQAFDVFADIKAFVRTRDYLHGHGYRLCLDGLSPFSFDLFDRAALGVDLLKINWDEGLTAGLLPERESRMAEAIRTEGPRLILARCDDDRAIEFGRSVGIAMFQGHEVDRLVNPLGWRPN